jgi:hypothetical protein
MWPYDPVNNTISADCTYNVRYLADVMTKLRLGDRWIYRNAADGSYHGVTEAAAKAFCAHADVFLNVSGCGWLRPEYLAIPKKIFLDSDPLFTQVALVSGKPDVIERIHAHDFHFTFAENIGAGDCRVPKAGLNWIPTRQPIVLDWFPKADEEPRDVFTSVMNWVSYKTCEFDGEQWGQKDVEFMKFIDLPQQTSQKFEMAMGLGQGKLRPTELLRDKGWQIIEPDQQLPDPWTYRDYLRRSKGEWSIAKEGYVKSRSGWFSCRSACYLALGRPCVLQDTGWAAHYPTGRGLFAFRTMAEAVAGIETVRADYGAHSAAARAVAEKMFDARHVLRSMLEQIGAR